MAYLILGAITVALVSWMLIDVVQELCARVTRLEKEQVILEDRIKVLEYQIISLKNKEDNTWILSKH